MVSQAIRSLNVTKSIVRRFKGENDKMIVEQKYFRVKDIKTILGISQSQAYNLVNSDGFPTIRIGKTILIPVEDFDKWQKNYKNREYKM